MIEFTGSLSGKSRKFLLRKQSKNQTICILIPVVIFGALVVALAVTWKMIAIILLFPMLMLLIGSVLPPSKNAQKILCRKGFILT